MSLLKNIAALFKRKEAIRYFPPAEDFSHLYNKDDNFTIEFYTNLAKTITYTENIISKIDDPANIDYARILRSINPVYKGKSLYIFQDDYYGCPIARAIYHPFNYEEILEQALSVRKECKLPDGDLKQFGKILKFENDTTTYDEAACADGGFVDNGDCPPIDSWFYVTKRYLYCWIPTMFLEKMQNAIDVEPLDSYIWLDESDPSFYLEIFKKLKEI